MLDPYRMVVVNIIALSALLIFLGSTKYVFHKNIKPVFIVILFSLLPVISILRKGVYESGDFNLHIYRSISFYENLRYFNLLPSWGHELNGGFGYPIFLIINPLPYYIISFFHFIGFSFIDGMKLFLIFSYIFSGIFMYLFTKKIFKNELAAITSSIFYLFTPYHLIDLHFRNDIGQILAFCIFPLCCLFFYKCIKYKNIFDYTALGILFGLLLISHQGIGLISLMFSFIFFLFFSFKNGLNKLAKEFKLIYSLILALTISSYALIPYFTYTRFTLMNISSSFVIVLFNIKEILYSPWRYGFLFQGPSGELSHLIGYVQIFVIVLLTFLVIKKKVIPEKRNEIIFFLFSSLFFSFMIVNESRLIWENIPLIENLIVSSRMLFIVAFTTAILSGYLTLILNKKIFIYLLIFAAISSTILNWGNRKTIETINDNNLIENLKKSTSEGEGYAMLIPKWVGKNSWENDFIFKLEIVDGNANITPLLNEPQTHEFLIQANSRSNFVENTWYFPGWRLLINGEVHNFTYESAKNPGLINFNLDKGIWKVRVEYQDLLYFRIVKFISISVFISSCIYLLYLYFKDKYNA